MPKDPDKNPSLRLGKLLIVVWLLTGVAVVLLPLVIVFLTSVAPASPTEVRKHLARGLHYIAPPCIRLKKEDERIDWFCPF